MSAWIGAIGGVVAFGMTHAPMEIWTMVCNAEGKLGAPGGWVWGKDENCSWTLYPSSGERAPDEVYEEFGPIPPPPPPNIAIEIGVMLVAVAVAVGTRIWFVRTRHERGSDSRPSNHSF